MLYGRTIAYNKRKDKHILMNQISVIESILSFNPNDYVSLHRYTELKLKLEVLQMEEAEGARLRSGQKWAKDGERCTKLFLNLEKQRANSNTIFYIKKDDSCINDPSIILENIKSHFKTIYKSTPVHNHDFN